jgi:hypothetical protein
MLELFPDLEKCSTEKEIRAFIKAHIQVIEDDEPETSDYYLR